MGVLLQESNRFFMKFGGFVVCGDWRDWGGLE